MNFTQQMIQENVAKLKKIIETIEYQEKWSFELTDDIPTKFAIRILTRDSTGELDGDQKYLHKFSIPFYDLTQEDLERYVFDRIMDVNFHEAMENFKVDGVAIFMPDHSETSNLYMIKRVQGAYVQAVQRQP